MGVAITEFRIEVTPGERKERKQEAGRGSIDSIFPLLLMRKMTGGWKC